MILDMGAAMATQMHTGLALQRLQQQQQHAMLRALQNRAPMGYGFIEQPRDPSDPACFDRWVNTPTTETFEEWCGVSVTL